MSRKNLVRRIAAVAVLLALVGGLLSTGGASPAYAWDWPDTTDDTVDAVKGLKVKAKQCPTDLNAEVCLKVTWYDNQELEYIVETKLEKDGDWLENASVTANSSGVDYTQWLHLHDGAPIKHNKRYWARVAVVDSSKGKQSDWREDDDKTWKKKHAGPGGGDGSSGDDSDLGPPTEVTDFKAVEKSDGSVVVKWKAPKEYRPPTVIIGDDPPEEDVVQGAGKAERFIVQVFHGCKIKTGQFICFITDKTDFPLVRLKEVGPNKTKVVFKDLPRPLSENHYDIRVQAVNSAGFSNWRITTIILHQ